LLSIRFSNQAFPFFTKEKTDGKEKMETVSVEEFISREHRASAMSV
jgi:hypothetical protein